MRTLIDQMNREVLVPDAPSRIISLVPSQTELLFDLGLDSEVVGITKFCVHPAQWFKTKTRVGGTKNINKKVVMALQADLVIANKEENTAEDIYWLSSRVPVWVSDICTINDAFEMISGIGDLCNKESEAKMLLAKIEQMRANLPQPLTKKRALYLIWKNPLMVAGRNTFVNAMLEPAGFENAISDPNSRYPILTESEIESLEPEVLLLSSEPFPFKGKHTESLRKRFPNIEIKEVDGELFSWYGSRMLKAFASFHAPDTRI